MTKHKTFEELHQQLLIFVKNNTRIPSSSSIDKTEKRLGNWCYQLRKKYRLKILSQDKIEQLQQIKIWFWNKQDFNKKKCFKELTQLNIGKSLLSKKSKNWIKNNKINIDSCVTIQNNKIVVSL